MKRPFIILLVVTSISVMGFGQNQNVDTNKARIEMLFREMHNNATWGLPTTGGIQLGVAVVNGKNAKQFQTFTYLYDESNVWIGLYPPNGYRLNVTLQDPDGQYVAKTKEGDSIGKPVTQIVKAKIWMRSRIDALPQSIPIPYESPFNILDCFNVKKAGTNTLTVSGTLYKRKTNNNSEIVLPPATLQVFISEADLLNYQASKNEAN
jgi:hypothetical protein